MPWTVDPLARSDLLLELAGNLDSSGNKALDWLDSAGALRVRVVAKFNGTAPTAVLEEGVYSPYANSPVVVRTQSITVASLNGFAELDLSARFYRLNLSGGTNGEAFNVSVRRVA